MGEVKIGAEVVVFVGVKATFCIKVGDVNCGDKVDRLFEERLWVCAIVGEPDTGDEVAVFVEVNASFWTRVGDVNVGADVAKEFAVRICVCANAGAVNAGDDDENDVAERI